MAGSLKSFEDLECWKAATQVRRYVIDLVKKFPDKERFALSDDMTRAACSATHNIAEGFGRFHFQENVQFCRQSRGSLDELLDQLITALDEKHITQDEFKRGKALVDKSLALLNGYINYLLRAKQETSNQQQITWNIMNLTLKVWRQKNRNEKGRFEIYSAERISPDASFLEMLDVVNAELVKKGEEPIAFDHDCREGICGSCGMMINGRAHGPQKGVATCELRMRTFKDGDFIVVEPWRAKPFPVIKDLVVDRTAFDRIMEAGGFISVNTGGAPDGNAIPIPKPISEEAMDAAACIGCGACVAACKNGSAMLFVSAKVSHLALLPQGYAERKERVDRMIAQMDKEGFGACSNTYACEAECPKQISVEHIARLNREYIRAKVI